MKQDSANTNNQNKKAHITAHNKQAIHPPEIFNGNKHSGCHAYNELLKKLKPGDKINITLIDELVSQIIEHNEQTKKEINRKRQAEGIAAARARGVHLGRPPKELPENYADIITLWETKKINLDNALKLTGMKKTTFFKYLREFRDKQ